MKLPTSAVPAPPPVTSRRQNAEPESLAALRDRVRSGEDPGRPDPRRRERRPISRG